MIMRTAGYLKLVFLVISVRWSFSLPVKETSTRRYNFHNGTISNNKTFLVINSNKSSSTTSTIFKFPKKPFEQNVSSTPRYGSTAQLYKIHLKGIFNNKTNNKSSLVQNFSNSSVKYTTPNTIRHTNLQNIYVKTTKSSKMTSKRPQNSTIKYFIKVKNTTPNMHPEHKDWPNSYIENIDDLIRYKNYTKINTSNVKKPQPYKIVSTWSNKPSYEELKESWSDLGIPIPVPNAEISTHSPNYVDSYSTAIVNNNRQPNPTNQFTLDMNQGENGFSSTAESALCPTVHLTNAVFEPTAKQGCSDLNIAINTHVHQSAATQRTPQGVQDPSLAGESVGTAEAANPVDDLPSDAASLDALPPDAESLDALPADAAPLDALEDPASSDVLLSPAAEAAPLETAAAEPASGATGGAPGGGTGGTGLPEFPGLPELPDLSQLLRLGGLLGGLWRILGVLFNVLRKFSPLLYIIPVISFIIGFLMVLPFYPWWVPLLFVFKKKEAPPVEVVYHKHIHKPIHHYDDLYWDTHQNSLVDASDHRKRRNTDTFLNAESLLVLKHLDQFTQKYSRNSHGWKSRKK